MAFIRRHYLKKVWRYQSVNKVENCNFLICKSDLSGARLIHLPLVSHLCVGELCWHCFGQWLITCSAPNHYLYQCWVIVNWTLRNKLQWNFNKKIQNISLMEMHLKISYGRYGVILLVEYLIYLLLPPLQWFIQHHVIFDRVKKELDVASPIVWAKS